MPFYPTLTQPKTSRLFTEKFYGYNHNLKINDGEFYDMKNLTGEYFPLLSQRKRRATIDTLTSPNGMLAKTALAYIDGTKVYYGEYEITGIAVTDGPKQLVSMGAYLCIFPDAKYFNTEDFTDCGSMGATFVSTAAVSYSICNISAADYTYTTTEPTEPTNGQYWMDTTGDTHILKQYSTNSAMWVQVPTVYIKITSTGIGANFKVHDGVHITVTAGEGVTLPDQITALNNTAAIYAISDNYIVIVGLLDQTYTQSTGTIEVERKIPKMDYVTESENRLWGCFYGLVDDVPYNEIYSCKLGDFKNWNCFMGISTDSYAVSVGSDGVFTGAITHLGYPLFFKENCIHKIYGNYPSNYQLQTTDCRGVQDGSDRSLQIVNETLYYKSRSDICAFDGSLPNSISSAMGNIRYYDAVAGTFGNKYYISMKDASNVWHMFVYDTSKGLWHKEDNTHVLFFTRRDDELYMIDVNKNLIAVNGTAGTLESALSWEAITGVIGYDYPGRKYLSRFSLRMNLPVDSSCDLYIQYNSSGLWVHMARMVGRGTDSFTIPIRPRRCDHMQIKLTGVGEIKLYSLSKILEVGSDV